MKASLALAIVVIAVMQLWLIASLIGALGWLLGIPAWFGAMGVLFLALLAMGSEQQTEDGRGWE